MCAEAGAGVGVGQGGKGKVDLLPLMRSSVEEMQRVAEEKIDLFRL